MLMLRSFTRFEEWYGQNVRHVRLIQLAPFNQLAKIWLIYHHHHWLLFLFLLLSVEFNLNIFFSFLFLASFLLRGRTSSSCTLLRGWRGWSGREGGWTWSGRSQTNLASSLCAGLRRCQVGWNVSLKLIPISKVDGRFFFFFFFFFFGVFHYLSSRWNEVAVTCFSFSGFWNLAGWGGVGLVWRGGNCVNNKTFLINSIFRIKAAPNFIFDRGFPVSSQNKRREKLKITEKCKNAWQQQ